jgi:hypothetical protein
MTRYERTGAALRGPRTYCSNLAQLSVGRDGAVLLKRHTRSQIVVFPKCPPLAEEGAKTKGAYCVSARATAKESAIGRLLASTGAVTLIGDKINGFTCPGQ